MEFVKYLILIFIFGTTSFIGILIGKKYSNRVKELQEIKNALAMFEAKIKFTYEPIPEIFKEISDKFGENIGQIFKNSSNKMINKPADIAWCEAIDESNNNMNKEDKEVLKALSKLLGKTDINGQISEIKLVSNFLNTQIEIAQKEKEKNEKMYKTLRNGSGTCYCYFFSLGINRIRKIKIYIIDGKMNNSTT